MNGKFDGSNEELISSEQLQVFDVIESFCEICGDLTPHHLENSKNYNPEDELSPDAICSGAISNHECVICRETEENEIKGL